MIELIQFPWSPYCLVQKRILEFGRVRFRAVDISVNDRSRVWRMTRQRYYQVPILRDGRNTVFETDDDSQVMEKYSGHYELPSALPRLSEWHSRMISI